MAHLLLEENAGETATENAPENGGEERRGKRIVVLGKSFVTRGGSTWRRSRARLHAGKKASRLRIGVYPGTFDPVTNGHLDIISRAARLVDRLIVAVAVNAGKGTALLAQGARRDVPDRGRGLKLKGMQVEVVPFDTLLMDFVTDMGANLIIRGLRAVSDFEYESSRWRA